ncbi:MAG TPA: tetratricopeptide repeat protein [Verrucomicrobiae bacterium]|nr:tetratricopeptide repeat protein [Verrucomicrobiae bacterium]
MKRFRSWFRGSGVGLACLVSIVGAQAQEQFTLETAQAGAAKGDAKAEYFLGKQYLKGNGVPQDDAKAADYFRKSAEQGLASAQNDLGALYAKGLGVKQDYAEAAQWYLKAGEQGDELAEYSLGRIYAEGRGVPADSKESLKWYRKAAEQNQPDALATLGDLYLFGGNGVSVNINEALKYYTNAVAHGHSDCLTSLGVAYERSTQIPGRFDLALKCFREAAAKKDGHADEEIGLMYRDGKGVQKDLVEAYKWFLRAQRNGAPMAIRHLQELRGVDPLVHATNNVLTPQQMAEGEERAAGE